MVHAFVGSIACCMYRTMQIMPCIVDWFITTHRTKYLYTRIEDSVPTILKACCPKTPEVQRVFYIDAIKYPMLNYTIKSFIQTTPPVVLFINMSSVPF